MCGIFGLSIKENSKLSLKFSKEIINRLFLLSESRGKESSGIAIYKNSAVKSYRKNIRARKFIKSRNYIDFWKESFNKKNNLKNAPCNYSIIGHTRLATNGSQAIKKNNQPITLKNLAGVHNGIVVNSAQIYKKFPLGAKEGESDSEALFKLFKYFLKKGLPISEASYKLFKNIEGSASVAAIPVKKKSLFLGTNTGSLYFCKDERRNVFIFASELPILRKFSKKIRIFSDKPIQQIVAGTGLALDLNSHVEKKITLPLSMPGYNLENKSKKYYFKSLLEDIKGFEKNISAPKIKRCKKCILPETIPFIKFNSSGVCNYCLTNGNIKVKGENKLKRLVNRYRKGGKKPDCLVAFSGGRDSSYALHYIKRVLKMNPIAFTFDWGMVSDIARRNQARMVGKLGIEHVVISSDINKKRRFIRQNIKAWLKRPDPGMVVLFMAGDKPAEYYAQQVAKKYDINLIFLCRGNELENSDFKWGLLGMKGGEPGGVLHNLSLYGRLQFTLNAAWKFIQNPYYINSSIWETIFDYLTTYVFTYKFTYLWHYIKWDESRIVNTLKDEYNWEVADDTIQTWRTDDGTSPFYNFIYYTMKGFTENDCFRSNQVREGILSRDTALRITLAENQPRYGEIKNYLTKIGLSNENIIKKIKGLQ